MTNDPEDGRVEIQFVNGYASLAAFIASDADKSTAIYRRFDRLSARNLLFLQSELEELQALQDKYDEEDNKGTTEQQATIRNLAILKERASEEGGNGDAAKARIELQNTITEKMKSYREALIFESTLLSLKPPAPRVLTAFQNTYNNHHTRGEPFPALGGSSEYTYTQDDLISLKNPTDEDKLTSFLRYSFPMLFVVRRTKGPLTYISESKIHTTVAVINVLTAAVLLFGAIYNLYYVSNPQVKLALIVVYTVGFSTCVTLFTNARRAEMFAASAGYAAVLVVFVGGGINNSNN